MPHFRADDIERLASMLPLDLGAAFSQTTGVGEDQEVGQNGGRRT